MSSLMSWFTIKNTIIILILGLISVLTVTFLNIGFIFAQTASDQSSTAPSSSREAELQAELNQVLQEIAQQQQILADQQRLGVSLERDVAILNAQISEAQLKIQAHNLAIQALGKDIGVKTQTIQVLSGQINQTRSSLGELLRQTNEIDAYTLTDLVLSQKNLSDFFSDIDSFQSIKQSIQVSLSGIKKSKTDTEIAKQTLDKQRLQQIDEKISIQDEQNNIKHAEAEKKRLLSLNKDQQKHYQQQIAEREAKAAAIRTALFSLRDTASIPFGTALEYATLASKVTGIRPAFLLAILTQESELGRNIGTCNRPGDPPEKGWQVIMKPSRDQAPFLRLTSALGVDPNVMPLSCPFKSGGYGGAMGPAQFIPSTWELFEPRISQSLGISTTPNPWNARDAFVAASLYLTDLGAAGGGYSGERDAACRYYSGRGCDSRKPSNSFYGNQVMAKATSIQNNMINPLNGV